MSYGDGYPEDLDALLPEGAQSFAPPALPQQAQNQRVTRLSSEPLYSAFRWAAGAFVQQTAAVFVAGLNQVGQGFALPLTELHTNLRTSGMTPSGDAWTINSFGVFSAVGNDADDVVNFMRHSTVRMGKKSYERTMGPSIFWPAGCGMAGTAMSTNPAVEYIEVTNGVPAAGAVIDLPTPIELASGEQFTFMFQIWDYLGAGLDNLNEEMVMYVKLFGDFASIVSG